jgi:hypothetical protein
MFHRGRVIAVPTRLGVRRVYSGSFLLLVMLALMTEDVH